MPTTFHAPPPAATPERVEPSRPRIARLPLVILAVVVLAITAGAALVLMNNDGVAPEDVVVDSLEAFNARDRAALEALYAPDITVSIDFRQAGGELLPDEVGRDVSLDQTAEFWRVADPTLSWEMVSVDDGMVSVAVTTTFGDCSIERYTSAYTVSEEGVITRIDHVGLP